MILNAPFNRLALTKRNLQKISTALLLALLSGSAAYANPQGATIANGTVTFANPNAQTLNITNTPGAIINWQSFGINQNEITRFIQQSNTSAILNRVTGQNPSDIMGQLLSNGQVFLINPNGIVFGPNSIVDTAGLIASSLNMSDQDFINGNLNFEGGPESGAIRNQGYIKTGANGDIYLIAPNIENSGIIETDGGKLILAAGEKLTIASLDSEDVVFEVQAPENAVVNLGELITQGGAASIFAGTITHSGSINADSVSVDRQGKVVLSAKQDITVEATASVSANGIEGGNIHIESEQGTTLVSGRLQVTGDTAQGGKIEILGENVGLIENASIDASGNTGGGQVLIGGDYLGGNAEVKNAKGSYVGELTEINADAVTEGDGGKVIVWSDDATRVYGHISATGGSVSGNGGFVETSGHYLEAFATLDISSANGKAGSWLLDPYNITIDNTTNINNTGTPNFTPNGNNSVVDVTEINAVLDLDGTVIVATAGAGGQAGDIVLAALGDIVKSAGSGLASLTLRADGIVDMSNGTINTASGMMDITINADWDNTGNGGLVIGLTETIRSNGGDILLSTASGNIDLQAGSSGASVLSNGGDITINSTGSLILGSGTVGASIGSLAAGTSGAIRITVQDMDIGALAAINSTGATAGSIYIRPMVSGTSIGLAGGTGTLNLTAAELSRMDASGGGAIIIGNSTNNDLVTMDTYTSATNQSMQLQTGGSIRLLNNIDMGTGNFTAWADPSSLSVQSIEVLGTLSGNTVTLLGGGVDNNETLIGGNTGNTWIINSGSNRGTLNGISFNQIGNLKGGTGSDTFNFTGGSLDGTIDGVVGGTDTLDYSALGVGVSIDIASGTASHTGGFTNITNFIGSTTHDQFIADNTVNTWNITGNDAGNINGGITFSSFSLLKGGTNTDNFVFSDGVSAFQIDGASTPSGNTVDLSAYTSGLTFSQAGTNTFNVAGMLFSNVGNLTGGSGNDLFALDSNNLAVFSGLLDGGTGTDVLNMANKTNAATINIDGSGGGTYVSGGFANFETVVGTSSTADILSGTIGADTFTLSAPNSATIGGVVFNSIENINGGSASDTFILDGGIVSGVIDGASSGPNYLLTSADTSSTSNITITNIADMNVLHQLTTTGDISITMTGILSVAGGALISGGDMALTAGNHINVIANASNALIQAGGNQTINTNAGLSIIGSSAASANAQLNALGDQTINAATLTLQGGTQNNSFAQIDPVLAGSIMTVNVAGNVDVQGGGGDGSYAIMSGDAVDLTAGGDITINGGAGNNAYGMVQSFSGDITLNATNITFSTSGGTDSDAVLHSNGGAGHVALNFSGTCTACDPLASDPISNGTTELGYFGIFGVAPIPPVVTDPAPVGDTFLFNLNEIVVLDDLFDDSQETLTTELTADQDEEDSTEKQILVCS